MLTWKLLKTGTGMAMCFGLDFNTDIKTKQEFRLLLHGQQFKEFGIIDHCKNNSLCLLCPFRNVLKTAVTGVSSTSPKEAVKLKTQWAFILASEV